MESLWKSTKKIVFVVVVGVIVYQLFENYEAVSKEIANFFRVLQPLFIGIAIAFIANMPMRFLERRLFKKWQDCGLKRAVCMALALLFVAGIIVAIMFLIIPKMVDSLASIVENFDSHVAALSQWGAEIWDRINLDESVEKLISDGFEQAFGKLDQIVARAAPWVVESAVSIVSLLANMLIAFIMSLYALYNKEKFIMQARKFVRAVFSEKTSERVLEICSRTNMAMNNYFYGMIIDCFSLGILCFIGMSIFKFPYALLISVIIGATQIVPIVGPWLGAIVGGLFILFVDPPRTIWFVVLILVVQQLDNNLVYPRVVGNAVGLSGIWVLIAILLGGGLWGLGGIILAVPIMAVCYTTVGEWVNKRLEQKRGG